MKVIEYIISGKHNGSSCPQLVTTHGWRAKSWGRNGCSDTCC